MSDIRGMEVVAPGTYVLMEDVVVAIREYAQSLDDPHSGGVVHELAAWLSGGEHPREDQGVRHVTALEPGDSIEALGHEPKTRALASAEVPEDKHSLADVYRVELYPDPPDDPRPRWYARSVDSEGTILYTTAGSFDYEYVYKEARDRWPNKSIYQLNRWADDSVFVENQEKKAYPTAAPLRERVSPKRMFA